MREKKTAVELLTGDNEQVALTHVAQDNSLCLYLMDSDGDESKVNLSSVEVEYLRNLLTSWLNTGSLG